MIKILYIINISTFNGKYKCRYLFKLVKECRQSRLIEIIEKNAKKIRFFSKNVDRFGGGVLNN